MAYVIAEPCIGVKDSACVDACPVDCIHLFIRGGTRRISRENACCTSIRWNASIAALACRFVLFRQYSQSRICRTDGPNLRR